MGPAFSMFPLSAVFGCDFLVYVQLVVEFRPEVCDLVFDLHLCLVCEVDALLAIEPEVYTLCSAKSEPKIWSKLL